MHIRSRLALLPFVIAFAAGCHHQVVAVATKPIPEPTTPDSFLVTVETTRGAVTLEVYREWAPRGVDRFYALVRQHYYDSAAVYRVIPGFVAQFGLAADPKVTARYRTQTIADDPVRHSNLRGTITFARSDTNSRTAQLFINLVDNAELDKAQGFGFPPIGRVLVGMDRVDKFNGEYGESAGRQQGSIARLGNGYLQSNFPRLDYIVRMTITQEWRH